MSKQKSVEKIISDLECPQVSVKLTKDELEFLMNYAEKRNTYNGTAFTHVQSLALRGILDRLFASYICAYETAEYAIEGHVQQMTNTKSGIKKERIRLNIISQKLSDAKRDDK